VRIRGLQAGEVPAIKAITQEAFAGVCVDYWIEQACGALGATDWRARKVRHVDDDVAAPGARVLVAEGEGGQVVGYVSARVDPRTGLGQIPNLAVRADHRGQGLGRQLLAAMMERLRRDGMRWAKIETLERNERGRALYPSLGFQEICRQIHYVRRLEPPD
jgi:ribosomal protein S18 acetylase RimI-like enzyme